MSPRSTYDNSKMVRRPLSPALSFLLRAGRYSALIFSLLLVRLVIEVWFKGHDDLAGKAISYAGESLVAGPVICACVHFLTGARLRLER